MVEGFRSVLFQCVHTCTYVTLDEQFSTCTQQHVLHTPYTYVYMQIKYCEVLLIPVGYNRLQYFVTFTCCTIVCGVNSTEVDSD